MNDTKETALSQQISFLKKISFFHDFDENELRQFLSVSKWLKVPANTEIIKEEATEKAFYILVKGKVLVFKTTSGKDRIVPLTTLKTGDCFGEMSLFLETKRTAGVKTTEDSFILMVDPDIINTSNVFLQLKFYKRFCEILVSRLIIANRTVVSSKTGTISDMIVPQQGLGQRQHRPLIPEQEYSAEQADSSRQDAAVNKGKEKSSFIAKDRKIPHAIPAETDKRSILKLQQLISQTETAYPINAAVVKRITSFLAEEETSNTRKFADIIGLDPYLSAKILQIANSPYYRRANIVSTIPHAMISLGMEQLYIIVKDIIDSSLHVKAFSGSQALYTSYWNHSVVVGRIADFLKEITRINISADVYLAGLLHDFGILPLDAVCPQFYPQLWRSGSFPVEDLEKRETDAIGVDHGKSGCWLGEKMGIPSPYLDVMQFHHAPEKAQDHYLLVALVHLADLFAVQNGICFGSNEKQRIEPLRSIGWMMLQEHHKGFLDVNVVDFVARFTEELEKSWPQLTSDLEI